MLIFKFLLLSVLFLFACSRTDNRLTESQYYFKDASEILSLHGNWRVTTNPDYNPITNKPNNEASIGFIPRMWFNSGITGKYIVSYNSEIEITESIRSNKYGILVFNVINANEVYINGMLIGKRGHLDKDKTKIKVNARPALYPIPHNYLKEGKNRITIRVADDAASGGFLEAPRFCEISFCEKSYNRFLLITGGTGFFILFIGIYHLVLFLGNRSDRAIFYFGAGTIFHGLTFLSFERMVYFFSDTFLVHFYTMNLSYCFSCIFSVIFIHSFLEKKMNWIAKFLLICFSISTLSSIIAGISLDYRSIHSRYILLLNVMCFVPVLSMQVIHLTLKAYKEEKIGSNLILFGFAFFIITNLLIPLHLLHIIPTKAFTLEGSLALIIFVTFALSRKARQTSERLLALEKEYRIELEKEVKVKTEAIQKNNQELQKSNSMKDKLFSIVAHDLRNPLFALEEVIFLFNDKHLTTKALQQNIISLSETLENNRFLLENLLQWSYIQLGYSPLRVDTIDLKKIIFESIQLHKSFAEKKQITVHAIEPKSVIYIGDEGIIRLILRNLLSNAIKFTHKGGRIEITCGKKRNYSFISVKDNGIGIQKKNLKNFFNQVTMEKNARGTEGEQGSGIGLTLCKDFAEKMGGSMKVRSKERQGSLFTLTWKE